MSDLWNRCRAELATFMSAAAWARDIEPLRAWMDAGVLHVWVERGAAGSTQPASQAAVLIRRAARAVWGREPEVVFWDRPPNRERIINRRRSAEHRRRARKREELEHQAYFECAREVARSLAGGGLRLSGTATARRVQLQRLVADRAHQQLRLGWSATQSPFGTTRAAPPREPPPANPPTAPLPPVEPPPSPSAAPRASAPRTRGPIAADGGDQPAGPDDLRAARALMPWLGDV